MAIDIDIIIVEPITLEIVTEPNYSVGVALAGPRGGQGIQGEKGDKGDSWAYMGGAKSSAIDAGNLGDVSFTDDYIYFCVQTGAAGNAIWKKGVVFAT